MIAASSLPSAGDNFIVDFLQWIGPPAWVPEWIVALTAAGIGIGLVVAFVSVLVMFSVWMERKVSGHIQCRYGPMYPGGWHGWAASIADGIKLLLKEDLVPLGADRVLFVLSPAIVLASIFAAFAAFPIS